MVIQEFIRMETTIIIRLILKEFHNSIVFTNKLGHEHTFFFRATPAYAIEKEGLDQSSLLEVLYIESEGIPRLQSVLDAPTSVVITDVQNPEKLIFSLIDFKVFLNELIYILTAKDGIYVLEFFENDEFAFVERIVTSKDQAYQFNVDYLLQEDDTIKEVIAILQSQQNYQIKLQQYQLGILIKIDFNILYICVLLNLITSCAIYYLYNYLFQIPLPFSFYQAYIQHQDN